MKTLPKLKFSQYGVILTGLAIILAMLLYLSAALQVRSDISFFLPQNSSEMGKLMQHQLKQGEAGKIILIALQPGADTPADEHLARFNRQLAAQLKQNSDFTLVQNGQMDNSALIVEPYYNYRYLINTNNDRLFSKAALEKSFAQLLQRLQFLLTPLEQILFAEDPQMIWLGMLKQWHTQQLQKLHGVWFDQQGRQTLLFVKTRANGYDLVQQEKNLAFINKTIRHLNSRALPAVNSVLTGAPVFALASREAISQQIKNISVIASLTLMAFLYWFFRSIKIVILSALPLGFAVLTGMTTVMLVDGFIHGISIAFGITIMGIAVDYPVHLYSHTLFLTENHAKSHQKKTVIQTIWPMLRLGLITTLIGFAALVLSDFSGLRQLGLFAISGLFAAAMFTRYVLPLFPVTTDAAVPGRNESAYRKLHNFVNRPMPCILRRVAIILPVLAIVFIGFQHTRLWQKDLSALSPVPQEQKQQDFELRKAMDLPELRYTLILQSPTVEELLQRSEQLQPQLDALKQQGIISGYDMAARYLPSIKQQTEQQEKLPQASELAHQLEQILSHSTLQAKAFAPFIKAIEKSKQMQPLSFAALLTYSTHMITDKVQSLLFQQSTTPYAPALWTAVIPLQGVQADGLQQSLFNQVKLLDLKTQTETMLAEYRNEALLWFFAGSLLILAVLFSGSRTLADLLPLAWPFTGAVVLTIASLLLTGYSLSIFHLVTLLLVVGLGIDYSIFTFFSRTHTKDTTQEPEVAQVSVIICMISTIIMFGALSLSSLPVLKAIGLTASLGALYAFLLTLVISRPCR